MRGWGVPPQEVGGGYFLRGCARFLGFKCSSERILSNRLGHGLPLLCPSPGDFIYRFTVHVVPRQPIYVRLELPAAPSTHSARGVAMREFRQLNTDAVHESPTNPRRSFSETSLEELTASVRRHGVLQPILVRPNGDGFTLIAGAPSSAGRTPCRSRHNPFASSNWTTRQRMKRRPSRTCTGNRAERVTRCRHRRPGLEVV